jgi:hypothetical protein
MLYMGDVQFESWLEFRISRVFVAFLSYSKKCTLRGDDWATVTKIRLNSERTLHLRPLHDADWTKQDKTLRPTLSTAPTPTLLRATIAPGRQIQISKLLCPHPVLAMHLFLHSQTSYFKKMFQVFDYILGSDWNSWDAICSW